MQGGILRRGRGLSLLAALVALLFVVGCGGTSDPEITVQSGALSKNEFTEKADAICKAARTEFLAKFTSFAKANKSTLLSENSAEQKAGLAELIDSVLTPNIEGEIANVGELGAPKASVPHAADLLSALQEKL